MSWPSEGSVRAEVVRVDCFTRPVVVSGTPAMTWLEFKEPSAGRRARAELPHCRALRWKWLPALGPPLVAAAPPRD